MSSVEIITKAREHAMLADCLLIKSGELLRLVVELGGTVGHAANTLQTAIAELHKTNEGSDTKNAAARAQLNQTAINTANGVVQLSSQAGLNIRCIIGRNDYPYLQKRRNGEATLIGTECALAQLFKEMTALAGSSVHEYAFTELHQRIGVMVSAAQNNIKTALANAVAVEAVGVMAIKISRTRQNH